MYFIMWEDLNNMPLVSIVIPAYQAEKYLADTLQSVKNQSYSNLEILIVDDGSTDNTARISQQFEAADSRFKWIHQKNAGVSMARNRGIKISAGEFIVLLDADDLLTQDSVALRMTKILNGNWGLVHGNLEIMDQQGEKTGKIMQGIEGDVLNELLLWEKTVIPTPSSVLFKKEILGNVGDFNKYLSNNADQEFFFRVSAKYKIGKVNEIIGYYRHHQGQMHKNIDLMYKDTIMSYRLARENGLFINRNFRNKCFSRMYFILANSYRKNAKNYTKATRLYLKSFTHSPVHFLRNILHKYKK